jgi:glycosyltransferase involved in cell wall biosynthesis
VTTLPPGFTLLQVVPRLDAGGVEQTTLDIDAAVVSAGGRSLVASAGGRMADRLKGELVELPVDSKNPTVMVANGRALRDLIRREGVSIVHARSRAPAFSALWAAKGEGVPFVATYAGAYNARSPLKRWYNGVMTRGDAVIANSSFTREHLLAQHRVDPEKVTAIPRGIDLSRFDPAAVPAERVAALREAWGVSGETRPVALLAGRLTRWKGQALAIEAVARLGKPPVLVLAGDDQGRDDYGVELAALAETRGLSEEVRIVGHCDDMPAAYLASDFALAPSLDPEAFGRTAVEPQLMGRPVLAADHGGARETVVDGETGWLVAPGDVEAWARALGEAISAGPSRRAAMGEAGQARARELYSLEAMTSATLDLYLKLLAR